MKAACRHYREMCARALLNDSHRSCVKKLPPKVSEEWRSADWVILYVVDKQHTQISRWIAVMIMISYFNDPGTFMPAI